MFGGNVTSSWANPQQQQHHTGAFGQPTGFGAANASAFGSTSAFGQPQQPQPQQQSQANPMFGNLSTPANTNSGTNAFGTFGSSTNASQSAFGAKPTTGFGAFGGGGGVFGSGTSAFGQPANPTTTGTTPLFGQPSTTGTTGAFGGNSAFGANKPSAFGTTPVLVTSNPPVVTTGTANPPYVVHTEKDANTTLQYQAISCIPAYAGYSFEELRLQDYTQGRKSAGGFGQSATFGTQPTPSLFGSAQPAQQNTTSIFGGGGSNSAPTNSGFGAFGATVNQPAQPATTGLFGGGTFGSTQQQPTTNAFGGTAFGQQQQPQQPTGLFGTSAFGNTANKPAFNAFSGGTTNAFGTGSAFGNTQNQQQQASQQPAQAGGLFGNTQPATTAFGGGTFSTTANKPLFGPTATTNQPTTGFGFGNNSLQQQQPPLFGGGGATGIFGNQQQQGTQPTPLFGGNTSIQQTGTSLFGGGGGGGGLFGSNQQQQPQNQQQPSLGLFGGNKAVVPAGAFGSGTFPQQQNNALNQTGGALFGGSTLGQPSNQQSAFGGSLFNKPAAPTMGNSISNGQTGGLFGSTLGASVNSFNASTANAGAQGTLTASISQPIGSNLPIFNMLPPGPRLVNLEQSQPKKKPPFFVDVPTRSPIPRMQAFNPANSKLRGFGSLTLGSSTAGGNPFANSVSFTTGKPNALGLHKSGDNRSTSLGPDGFLGRSGSPSLGSGNRQSVKKVILDKKVEPSQLFVKSGSPGLSGGKVVFSPALSIAARESEAAAAANSRLDSPVPVPRLQRSPNRFTAQSTKDLNRAFETSESTALEEGDYWVKPELSTLKKLGYDQLSAFEGLVIGRVGYGEIHFLEPVDLTGLVKLSALLGQVIHFDDKECSVYPDSEEADKPPPGSGLNVKARLILERCWAVDKATREPIKDATHAAVVKHLKRLRNMKETHFESFDMETGKWTFTVEHF